MRSRRQSVTLPRLEEEQTDQDGATKKLSTDTGTVTGPSTGKDAALNKTDFTATADGDSFNSTSQSSIVKPVSSTSLIATSPKLRSSYTSVDAEKDICLEGYEDSRVPPSRRATVAAARAARAEKLKSHNASDQDLSTKTTVNDEKSHPGMLKRRVSESDRKSATSTLSRDTTTITDNVQPLSRKSTLTSNTSVSRVNTLTDRQARAPVNENIETGQIQYPSDGHLNISKSAASTLSWNRTLTNRNPHVMPDPFAIPTMINPSIEITLSNGNKYNYDPMAAAYPQQYQQQYSQQQYPQQQYSQQYPQHYPQQQQQEQLQPDGPSFSSRISRNESDKRLSSGSWKDEVWFLMESATWDEYLSFKAEQLKCVNNSSSTGTSDNGENNLGGRVSVSSRASKSDGRKWGNVFSSWLRRKSKVTAG
ncbi:hypothetical protein HDU76_004434 [Blyttiomyces sp. JEL0837]|nr:hypothetical protein HDU76_004434 [Blyttiomyces sp. JEL0837]